MTNPGCFACDYPVADLSRCWVRPMHWPHERAPKFWVCEECLDRGIAVDWSPEGAPSVRSYRRGPVAA